MKRLTRAFATAVLAVSLAMSTGIVAAANVAQDPESSDIDAPPEDASDSVPFADLADGEFVILDSDQVDSSLLNADPVSLARTSLTAGGTWVICAAGPDSPHYSTGAKGAIYKVRIGCSGSGYSYVTVKVNCTFMYRSYFATSWQRTRTSSGSTSVKVNGDRGTVYCPTQGNLGTGTGYWQGSGTYRITWPGTGALGTYATLWGGTISAR
ncbi:hypothetical protein [Demequina sp. NBRC 110052]|uniref:hypothetical protein n=1 Tax=Demequina sp. NBRC 110052 TaxID=1570341 RepID=UPI00117FFEF7|nr:hypothetical protein [Demequina sp. NBRC 110052]